MNFGSMPNLGMEYRPSERMLIRPTEAWANASVLGGRPYDDAADLDVGWLLDRVGNATGDR